jgi:hypothetical protein
LPQESAGEALPVVGKILAQLGLTKSLQRIKFGGVVGKQTLLAMVGVSVLGVIAWRIPSAGLLIAVLVMILVLTIAGLSFWYAHRHPAEAMLEGAEMLALQHQILAAKSLEPPKDSAIIPNPEGKSPERNPPEGADQ